MNAPALPPTAPTTLVILLGASAWPNSPGFQASKAFTHAAQGFRNYVLDPQGLGLPEVNLLDLFDAQPSASDQLEMLGSFLEQRAQALKVANQMMRDVLVYFVGHGGFAGPSADFYLMHRRANASSLRASGMAIDALAEVLREKARQARRYLFLDCCFAAAAFRAFQGGPDQTAIAKTLDAFGVQARSNGFPRKGMGLLCSSDQKSPSLLLPDESCTMFSSALLDVLKNGDLHRPEMLSLRDIKELAQDRLAALPERNAPRPGLYSPDQSEGDVADVPFFRNISVERERLRQAEEEQRRLAEEAERVRKAVEERLRQAEAARQHEIEEERVRKEREAEQVRFRLAQEAEQMPSPAEQIGQAPDQSEQERLDSIDEHLSLDAAKPPLKPVTSSPDTPESGAPSPPLPSLPRRPKRLRSPIGVAVLIGLTLILLGGGGVSMYDIITGHFPWNPGTAWRIQHANTSNLLTSVAWSGLQFVAVGVNGTIFTSPDGNTWTPQHSLPASASSQDLAKVIWAGTQFVAVGANGTILTSNDGDTWISHAVPASVSSRFLHGVALGSRIGWEFVAVGAKGTVLTSNDGNTWIISKPLPPSVSSSDLIDVMYDGAQYVAVGANGTILISSLGDNWTIPRSLPPSASSRILTSVAWSGSQYVAVGGGEAFDNSMILISQDRGDTWTISQPLPASASLHTLFGVGCSNSQCMAVGIDGIILTSPDGRTWTIPPGPPNSDVSWLSVVWSGSHFVAVGSKGTILISP